MVGWLCSLCSDSLSKPLLPERDHWRTWLTTLLIPSTTTPGHMPPTSSPESELTKKSFSVLGLLSCNVNL
ncbi:hypothetical protein NC653_027530 [Populus alba x Populus x berolinensis]|uniref:Uncharacterized protein n=1 Tax=Populus alba x Populus x berolinensis TaxID=444605 RepID=A0AAD6Q4Y7_9ROSI|nr:hypothetical protein NC653_027530 [Populus alba x Populus x berolinensis]